MQVRAGALKILFVSRVDGPFLPPHKKFNGVKAPLAFLVVLMFIEHTPLQDGLDRHPVRTA